LWLQHHRARKTGPAHPLAVIECRSHGFAFTLYPPGYAPYLRRPVVKLGPDGGHIVAEPGSPLACFEGTIFAAAVDAMSGKAWPRESSESTEDRSWGSQGRDLDAAARIVGVACDLGDAVRTRIAAALSVGTLLLLEGARATGYRAIGKAVCEVLRQVRGFAGRAMKLLIAGFLASRFGEPMRFDHKRKVVERSPFCAHGASPPC
jgi:hypothetical protein